MTLTGAATPLRELLLRCPLFDAAPAAVMAICEAGGQTVRLAAGDTLVRAGERNPSLFLVIDGALMFQRPGEPDPLPPAPRFAAGDLLGEIHAVTGQAYSADAVATEPSCIMVLSAALLGELGERFAPFNARLTQLATRRLRHAIFRRTVHGLLAGMEPALVDAFIAGASEVSLARGACLMRQGDEADAWYVLTSGRLSVVAESADGQRRVADLMPGASVGEMAVITGGRRNATVRAEREASLMRLAKSDFERFADAHPAFARRLMGVVVQRLSEPAGARRASSAQVIVVLRASASPALATALDQLGEALGEVAAAVPCRRREFEATIGRALDGSIPETHPAWSRFDLWVEEAQRDHAIVLLDGGHADDLWRRECLLHADRCLWLAEPVPGAATLPPADLLESLDRAQQWARRDSQRLPWSLLLAHAADAPAPVNTRAWLQGERFERHLHLRLGDAVTMQRAARLLAGKGVGVALSGGGARGMAHIGALKAMLEAGVPIDIIGGTSFGAIQAGMFAMGLSIDGIIALNREVMALRPFSEYTLPLIALIGSRRRDAGLRHAFGERQIEDLWLPYLAVSTDLCAARPVVHERGSLGLAIGASCSLPGVLVPVIDGERILVDGGIVNNFPTDLVKARCGGRVFAVKVAPNDDLAVPVGGFPSPWAVLWHRLAPWLKPLRTPRLGDLLIRTMTVSSADRMQRAMRDADVLIEPEVASYGMLQFSAMEPLIECGYRAARQTLEDWKASHPADDPRG